MKKEKLKEGDELLFWVEGRKLMERVKVESLDKKGGYATLSNRVKIYRIPNQDDTYSRIDGKEGVILPINEKNEKLFEAYKAYFSIKRNLEFLDKELKNRPEGDEILIEFNKKFAKIIDKYLRQ